MALFSLTYDLVKTRDYQKLYDELDRFNAIRVTESQWYFKRVNTTAKGLRIHFSKFVDNDDRLMIAQVAEIDYTPQWSGKNLIGSPNDLK